MSHRRLQQLREFNPSDRAPTPPPNPRTVAQAMLELERRTLKNRRSLRETPQVHRASLHDDLDPIEEADLNMQLGRRPQYIPPKGFSDNMKKRYATSTPSEEEKDKALDEYADRIFHNKCNTQLFGEDNSSSKLTPKKRGKKVRAMEKLRQLEAERHNAVPLNDEELYLRTACTTAMFGADLSQTKTSTGRRAPVQPSLVGVRNTGVHAKEVLEMMEVERTRAQLSPETEDAMYVTLEEFQPGGLKPMVTADLSSNKAASKLPSLAPKRHSLTGKGTAAASNIPGLSSLLDPVKQPVTTVSDITMATENIKSKSHQKRTHRKVKDGRALKRRCENPGGPVRKH